jgi:TDG/mug DNA glycosylase family protein
VTTAHRSSQTRSSKARTNKPSPERLAAAEGKRIRDVIAPELRILFCGINPSLYSAATGHHFGRPGNRFWPALAGAGLTDRQLLPAEQRELLQFGLGITNVVSRATATAAELETADYLKGGKRLRAKVERFRPRVLAVLGIGAYRTAFDRPDAAIGRQSDRLGETRIWVLPNPSGLNAHYQLDDLVAVFRRLRIFAARL